MSVDVITLIKDLNGNHVVQKCLNYLSHENNQVLHSFATTNGDQFIYDAVTVDCVQVATHRHGCCVLQRCIDYATDSQKKQMVDVISDNALILVQVPALHNVLSAN